MLQILSVNPSLYIFMREYLMNYRQPTNVGSGFKAATKAVPIELKSSTAYGVSTTPLSGRHMRSGIHWLERIAHRR